MLPIAIAVMAVGISATRFVCPSGKPILYHGVRYVIFAIEEIGSMMGSEAKVGETSFGRKMLTLRVLSITFGISLAISGCNQNKTADGEEQIKGVKFAKCGAVRRTCVVDGDTFWFEGRKIRVADIDTPEIGKPKCDSELASGLRATQRFIELLNAGPFGIHSVGSRDRDRYGRELRVVTRNGRSLGDQLVSEGLARTWSGRREPWC